MVYIVIESKNPRCFQRGFKWNISHIIYMCGYSNIFSCQGKITFSNHLSALGLLGCSEHHGMLCMGAGVCWCLNFQPSGENTNNTRNKTTHKAKCCSIMWWDANRITRSTLDFTTYKSGPQYIRAFYMHIYSRIASALLYIYYYYYYNVNVKWQGKCVMYVSARYECVSVC